MHTAEHILNQTMVRMFSCNRSFSAHINKKKSKCDYHFSHALSAEDVQEIEERVNEQITRNLPVTETILPRHEAEKLLSLEKLPDNAGEDIRIIRIGDYDICPCIGEHVANTNELATFKIISSDFTENVLRLRFKLVREVS